MLRPALAVYDDQRQNIADFMSGFSLETTPGSAANILDFREHVRVGASVYITFLAGSDFNDTIAVAKRLRKEGFNPVPHCCARSIPNKEFFEQSLKSLHEEAGVSQVLLVGGAVPYPVGEFSDSMQLVETGLLDKYGITKIGFAGHPEGSPDIPELAIKQAIRRKNEFARRTDAEIYLVTQFCFEAEPIIRWDKIIQAEGNKLPIHIGIPGLATVKTLLAHAKACGIGPSARLIAKQAMNVAKLLTVSTPDRLVTALADYQAHNPSCGIKAAHVFPLGGLKKSADWSYAAAEGRFQLHPDGKGFSVDAAS